MEKEFWNKRYSETEYVYGTEPNEYLRQELDKLIPGELLLLGEGEGRNAVYAAKRGWKVTAVDFSENAKQKALLLAKKNNVTIKYIISSIEEFKFPESEYDAVSLIFVHFPPKTREIIHKSIIGSLKKNGIIIIEAFSKKQISNDSGGPREISSLYIQDDFKSDFEELVFLDLSEHHIRINEGPCHNGPADVIRFKAQRK